MGFTEAVKTVFSKYATFSGRATRSEFWWFYLFNIIMYWGLTIIGMVIGGASNGAEGMLAGGGIGMILTILYGLAIIIPTISVCVRRLHDTNRSGWNYWWCLLPIVGAIILLVFFVQGSYPADNEYGPYEA